MPDFWDVSFMNEMFGRMATDNETGSLIKNNNFSEGAGRGLRELEESILPSAEAVITISHREANATNIDFLPVSAKTVADLIENGVGVMLVLLVVEPAFKRGEAVYNIKPLRHAVAVKGWTKNASADGGFIFKIHDPFGPTRNELPQGTPTIRSLLGLVRSVQLSQVSVPFHGVYLPTSTGQPRDYQSNGATWVAPNPNANCGLGNPCYILGGVITFKLKDRSGIVCSTQAFDPARDTPQLKQKLSPIGAAKVSKPQQPSKSPASSAGAAPIRVPGKK